MHGDRDGTGLEVGTEEDSMQREEGMKTGPQLTSENTEGKGQGQEHWLEG